MNYRLLSVVSLSFVFLAALLAVVGGATLTASAQIDVPPAGVVQVNTPLSTTFTYQGQLKYHGSPATGTFDFEFRLYDAATGGAQVGSVVALGDISVTGGLFVAQLDFGADAFTGAARWLEIAVRPGAETTPPTILSPRQALTAAPYALHATSTGALQGYPISLTSPLEGQALVWSSGAWSAQAVTGTVGPQGPIGPMGPQGPAAVITAGTGLTLNQGLISLLSVFQLPQACANDQVSKWNGSGWVCAADNDTTYTAGYGLALNGGQFSAVTGTLQGRVADTCAVGSTIRAVNADGTVVCEAHDVRPGFSLTTLDSTGDVGTFTSVTIGADGLPLISYYDYTNGDLKAAHCSNAACSAATVATLDSDGDVGHHTSVTIGADGLPLISYGDTTNYDLKVAHCSNADCSAATVTTLDSAGIVGFNTSVIIGTDGLGLISYYDYTNGDLKTAHCANAACTAAVTTTLDSAGDVGSFPSVTIGTDGLGLISYYDVTNKDLKTAHCSNTACTAAITTTLDSAGDVGSFPSVTIGTDGLPLISYRDSTNGDLKAAHCFNVTCTTAITTTLDSAGNVGFNTSVTLGADGLGLISYFDAANTDLKVAHCSNVTCTTATYVTLDSAGTVGQDNSVTIGTDGLPLISYFDLSNYDLKVAHCSNALCTPYVRRR